MLTSNKVNWINLTSYTPCDFFKWFPFLTHQIFSHALSAITGKQNEAVLTPLQWRQNGCDGVSNHRPRYCLLDRLFWSRWKKNSRLYVTGLCTGNSPVTCEFPYKWPVTRKIFPFDDVIMIIFDTVSFDTWKLAAAALIVLPPMLIRVFADQNIP